MAYNDKDVKKHVVERLYRDRLAEDALNAKITPPHSKIIENRPKSNGLEEAQKKAILAESVSEAKKQTDVYYRDSDRAKSDGRVYSRIIFALFSDPEIDDTHIGVCVEDGRVTLNGTVAAYRQKYHAEEVAARKPGVISINNRLAIVSSKNLLDHRIAENIIGALERNPLVNTRMVDVKVEQGVVILTGTVESAQVRHNAYEDALNTPGVISVNNFLVVHQK